MNYYTHLYKYVHYLCLGVELMVELCGSECPEPVSEEAAKILKLFSIRTSFPSVSHN